MALSTLSILTGTSLQIGFSDANDLINFPALTTPAGWTVEPSYALEAVTVTVTDVTPVAVDTVILTVSRNLTRGGDYTVNALSMGQITTALAPIDTYTVLSIAEAPTGTALAITASQPLLPTANYPIATLDLESPANYSLVGDPLTYADLTVVSASLTGASEITTVVTGLTTLDYQLTVAPGTLRLDYPDVTGLALFGTGSGTLTADFDNNLYDIETTGQSSFSIAQADVSLVGDMSMSHVWYFRAAQDMVLPPGENPTQLITFAVSDGTDDLRVVLTYVDTGVLIPIIRVLTGPGLTLLGVASVDWQYATGQHNIEVLRNAKAQTFTVFCDGLPLVTSSLASLAATDLAAGTHILLNGQGITDAHMYLYTIRYKGGYPLYTTSWDPVWETVVAFTGAGNGPVTSVIKTAKGPLVKPWGDYTPATKNDVMVTINGVDIPVSDVNPYTGDITLVTPWPRNAAVTSATVAYNWIDQPLFPVGKLNTEGLVLNKYDRDYHYMDAPISSSPNPSRMGVAREGRFRYGVVLGSNGTTPAPIAQPVSYGKRFKAFQKGYSALLNHAPSLRLNHSPFQHAPSSMRHEIEMQSLTVIGNAVPASPWSLVAGTATTDSVDTLTLTNSLVTAPVTLDSVDHAIRMAWRHATDTAGDGSVFTGVLAGFKDYRKAYLVGNLVVNDVKHMGVLNDETQPHVVASWDVLYPLALSIRSTTTAVVTGLSLQAKAGDRFQILSGTQAGVYTLTAVTRGLTATTIAVSEPFPANYKLYGNRDVTGYGEVPDNVTVFLTASTERTVTVKFLDVSRTTTASVENFLGLPASSVFFGHVSSTGTSTWKFVRAALTGPLSEVTTGSLTNTYSASTWAEGERSYLAAGTLIQSEASSVTSPDTFYTSKAVVDTRLATSGMDAETRVIMSDGKRDITLSPIVYAEYSGKRHKVDLGRLTHAEMTASDGTLTVTEDLTSIVSNSTGEAWLTGTLTPAVGIVDAGDRVLSVVFRGSALDIQFSFGPTFQHVRLLVDTTSGTYGLYSGAGAVQTNGPGMGFSSTGWNWLRVLVDPVGGSLVSFLNGNLVSTTAAVDFTTTLAAHRALTLGTSNPSETIDFKSISFRQGWQSASLYTTLGIRRRSGDETSIDGWELPRTDSSTALNSTIAGPVIQAVDIDSAQDLRLRVDPEWGATLYITTLGPSPFYGGAATSFFDEITEPSAGWINLAISALPRATAPSAFGSVSLQGYSNTTSLYYRLSQPTANRLLPDPQRQNMVLNRGHVLTSGEHLRDRTPEVKVATVLSSTVATLQPTDYYASRIFRVVDGATTYTGNDVTLARDGQTITLLPVPATRVPRSWSSSTVTVTFALDKPSESYMTDETVQSSRQLNDGVPLYEHVVYTGDSYRILLTANAEQPWVDDDESRVLDLTRATEFVDPDNVHYLAMKQYVVNDGGVEGLIVFPRKDSDLTLGVSGPAFYETAESVDPDAPSTWAYDGPLFAPLVLGGGGYLGSTIASGITITWGTESLGGVFGASVFLPTEGSPGLVSVYDVTMSEAAVFTDTMTESDFSAVLA